MESNQSLFLGKNSYPAIVKEIFDKIQKAECQTLTGTELLKDTYKTLNESITPIHDLKPFITGAEKIAGDDATIKDIVDFCKKKVAGGDLNFIINMCKEEHFQEMNRLNHPSPADTVKEITGFDDPASVIEQGIKAGLFDGLKSKLLNKIKVDLGVEKPLNESNQPLYNASNNNLIKYSPIGIKLDDLKNNRMVVLTESDAFSFDYTTKKFKALTESIELSDGQARLMNAINGCSYDPEKEVFSLKESWDFDLELKSNGRVFGIVGGIEREIPKDKIKALLTESIQVYASNPTKVDNFNKLNYLKDADNFVMLVENSQYLVKFDNLEVLRNLNESSYVVVPKVTPGVAPMVLSTSTGKYNQNFNTYREMIDMCESEVLKVSGISNLFESHVQKENEIMNSKNMLIQNLMENQQKLNAKITEVQNLKSLADNDSPAFKKLFEQENRLNQLLDKNLKDLNDIHSGFKLY